MTGEKIYDLGITRIGCKYSFGVVVPKDDEKYTGSFDCAEFTSWLTYQVGGFLYGCSTSDITKAKAADAYTGFWDRDAKAKGIIISVKEAIGTKGAFLIRVAADGQIGHIVASNGNGGTIEAHSTKYGVITSTTNNRRFDYGILLPGFTYPKFNENYVSEKPKGIVYRFTTPLIPKSDVVKRIQSALIAKGYNVGKSGADGWYGKDTMNAVSAYQKKTGLNVDGEVYTATAKALNIKL